MESVEAVPKNALKCGLKCAVKSCGKSKRQYEGLRMFKFPPCDSIMGQVWREKCNINIEDYSKSIYICGNHFLDSDMGKKKLKSGAVPIYQLEEIEDDYDFVEPECSSKKPRFQNYEAVCNGCEKYAKSVSFYRKKYFNLLNKFKTLKKQFKKVKYCKLPEKIDSLENISKESKNFFKLLLCNRPKQYSKDEKELTQNIFYVSQSTYAFLRNKLHFNLPHIASVNRWAPVKFLQPGFLNNSFESIKQKCLELK